MLSARSEAPEPGGKMDNQPQHDEFTDTGIIKIQRALDGASERLIAHFVRAWTPVEPKELLS